jgi:hypothetical protein
MKIFKIKTDTNNIQQIQPTDFSKVTLERFTFDCVTKSSEFDGVVFYVNNPKVKSKSFYSTSGACLVFDEKTLELCRMVFEMCGEILPIHIERGEDLYILNILECMNGLNYDTTEWDYYKDGTKGRILKYGFHPERVMNESTIFKIPETSKTDIFCWADVKNPDDEFYHLYHKYKLTGLVFEEMFNSKT